jgi:hypothetical protein
VSIGICSHYVKSAGIKSKEKGGSMIKIYIHNDEVLGYTNLYIVEESKPGLRRIAKPLTLEFEPLKEAQIHSPTLVLPSEGNSFLSELSEALIKAGYRDNPVDNTGEIKRLENHLSDLRSIIFKKEIVNAKQNSD